MIIIQPLLLIYSLFILSLYLSSFHINHLVVLIFSYIHHTPLQILSSFSFYFLSTFLLLSTAPPQPYFSSFPTPPQPYFFSALLLLNHTSPHFLLLLNPSPPQPYFSSIQNLLNLTSSQPCFSSTLLLLNPAPLNLTSPQSNSSSTLLLLNPAPP